MRDKSEPVLADFTIPAGSVVHVDDGVPIKLTSELKFTAAGPDQDERLAKFASAHQGAAKGLRPSGGGGNSEPPITRADLDEVNKKLATIADSLARRDDSAKAGKSQGKAE